MKKDISANLYQKCLILCSVILSNVLHIMSSKVLLPWQYTGFQISPILKAFLTTFWYLLMVLHIHDPASIGICYFKFVALFNVYWSWKSTTYWNKVGGNWKRVSCHGNSIFYIAGLIPLELLDRTIDIVCIILGWVYDVISHLVCMFWTFFKHKYLRNYWRYLQMVNSIFILSWNSMSYS